MNNVVTTSSPVLMTATALDELPNGNIILRGVLTMESLCGIRHDDYQTSREVTSQPDKMIRNALSKGHGLPDIVLGMRGQNFVDKNGVIQLVDPVYVIDGLQRITAILRYLETKPDFKIHLGAAVHFDTNLELERAMFVTLNTTSLSVSPNGLLYTLRGDNQSVNCLYEMSDKDTKFILKGKVSWKQGQARHELIGARTLLMVSGRLHSHLLSGAKNGGNALELAASIDRSIGNLGLRNYRENIRTFFDLVDECFGIRNVYFKGGANHLKQNFLNSLAQALSSYVDFWQNDGKKLVVEISLRRKLKAFPITDPTISQLSNAGGGLSTSQLSQMIIEFLNSGKRTKRLTPRNVSELPSVEEEDASNEAA